MLGADDARRDPRSVTTSTVSGFQIAVAHLRAAEEARTRAAEAVTSGEAARANHEETQATMVVIAAAAFCIDALYVKLDGLLIRAIGPTPRSGLAASSRR